MNITDLITYIEQATGTAEMEQAVYAERVKRLCAVCRNLMEEIEGKEAPTTQG